ncbi:longevity assurance proteins LAG1/LAC1 [Sistotremastrum niveocremeum HHB9708]|uniref:Longevity assurance proteins LAG1/LAC1 n=1 Tax=Sistotremastrum niveocremeum HHB9708 TaxID=1314777 RepID=A0A164ZQ48_9AGAM|nr:longevity assurance proteins LAG1/LAC1 [Sistotremastrum niveocremeum HHB9708]
MSEPKSLKARPRASSLKQLEGDPAHHLAGSFVPQTPLESAPLSKRKSTTGQAGIDEAQSQGFWSNIRSMQWMRVPTSSLKLLAIPAVLYVNWQILAPALPNPFASVLFISHKIPGTPTEKPLYQKGYNDIPFVLYYIIMWSFVRQVLVLYIFRPFAQWWGIPDGKLDRYGEQGYALLYFGFSGSWGLKIMSELPTWYYNTKAFWIGYPHWEMIAELKWFYLLQMAYWMQQLLVLALRLEKPRKDYNELVIHHIVTLWLVCWSYLVNLTYIGNAIFVSMDIPDAFLAITKLLNYMQLENFKNVMFVIFIFESYFRHWLNLLMIKSVWDEFHLMPETSKQWNPPTGAWMVWWMQYQVLVPIVLLQLVQLFWYFLIWRILYRAVFQSTLVDDERSDDEDEPVEKAGKKE